MEYIEKLTLKDIMIQSPGQQIRNLILKKFDSLDVFADEIKMEIGTIKEYLKGRRVGSRLFKVKLCKSLNQPFDEIVKSKKAQIKTMVQNIYENIHIYKNWEDIHVLMGLAELSANNNLKFELSKMHRNIAMHYFYCGNSDKSIGFMNGAISSIKNRDYIISWKSELGLIYYSQCNYKQARKIYREVDELLVKVMEINQKTIFLHYYRYGLLETDTDNHSLAEKFFRMALENAKTNFEIASALTNIGVIYKLRGNYEEAIKYYNKALDIFQNDLDKSRVFNNLAELYKSLGQYDEALKYIKLAFSHVDNGDISKYFIYYQTYAQIQIIKGEYSDVISKLYKIVMNIENVFTYKQTLINGIKILVNYSIEADNIIMLEYIEDLIVNLINKTQRDSEKYLHDLYGCIGKINIYRLTIKKEKKIKEV